MNTVIISAIADTTLQCAKNCKLLSSNIDLYKLNFVLPTGAEKV
jgi:hypothetical protein